MFFTLESTSAGIALTLFIEAHPTVIIDVTIKSDMMAENIIKFFIVNDLYQV